MITKFKSLVKCATGALAISLLAGPALAQGYKDGPAMTPERAFAWSGSFAVGSDYVFRGFSQTAERPTVQGSLEATYGILYGNVFLSNLDFGDVGTRDVATAELTFGAGIRPVLGPITFDLGVIYYTYPKAIDPGAELNFFELRAGGTMSPWKGGTAGLTIYYSPEYTGKTGDVWTFEGTLAHELPKMGIFTPTVSALLGYQTGDAALYEALIGQGGDYLYWNAGVSLGFHERFSIDLRYWGTDNSGTFCDTFGRVLNCGDRFVGTAKVTF
jgi:uncharacterized protein (TIGR02001 family)